MKNIILLTKEEWQGTMLSIAQHVGSITIKGHTFSLVNSEGEFEFTNAQMKGSGETTPPDTPCDLVRCDFVPLYKRAGREKFIEMLGAVSPDLDPESVKTYMEQQLDNFNKTTN